MPRHNESFAGMRSGWRALLNLGFGLLCLRFLFAAGQSADWTFGLLTVTGFGLAWWRPSAGLFVLVLSLPLIGGLEKTVLSLPYSAVLAIASSLWLGLSARKLFRIPPARSPGGASASAGQRPVAWPDLLVEVLAIIALVSLGIQIWRQDAAPDFWRHFWQQTSHGTGDPAYFLTAGFLWLHGLFNLRALRESEGITPGGIKLVFLVHGILLLFFFGLEWLVDLPARWTPGFQSPYEDIATFGIMAACGLLLCLTLMRRESWPRTLLLGMGTLLLVVAVGASWSRGTWLTSAVFLCVLALLRLPRTVAIVVPAILLSTVVLLNLNANRIPLESQSFLERLMSLVRFEDPRNKSDRFDLYQKAWVMIRAQPWTGHGIGTFYNLSPRYARQDDPNGAMPQLPHNILLQLAAEQGVPAATLFIGLIGWILWRGIRCWNSYRRLAVGGEEGETARSIAHLTLALTLALGAYLQANMTWDILMVHPSQPYFFWFLMAALWATTDRANRQIASLGEITSSVETSANLR